MSRGLCHYISLGIRFMVSLRYAVCFSRSSDILPISKPSNFEVEVCKLKNYKIL